MKIAQKYGGWLLLLFHVIGAVMILRDPNAASLSYLNISLCALVLFLAEFSSAKALIPFAFIFIPGFIIEYLGVTFGWFFGDYAYDTALGPKVLGVPLVIGFNWYAIIVSGSAVSRMITSNRWLQIILTAVLCTALDVLIEPVAIHYGFWHWSGPAIPLSNYIAWFIFSLLFAGVYAFASKERNRPAEMLWGIWILFFLLLNWQR